MPVEVVNLGISGSPVLTGPLLLGNGTQGAPAYSFSGQPNTGMFGGAGPFLSLSVGGTQALTINANAGATIYLPVQQVTAGTMSYTGTADLVKVIHRFDWNVTMVNAIGAVLAGDISVCTLPPKTVVTNCYMVILTPAAGLATLTIAVGRVGAGYIDYIVASDGKAAANTVYGGSAAQRGTNLTGFDLPVYSGTATTVNAHFIATVNNLSTATASAGCIYLETMLLP